MSVRAVDLFAGAGGWSCGAESAGVRVVAGANHWPRAVETFRAAHPGAVARCQDVTIMDPRDLPAFDLLLASPACQGHSRARGTDQPHHDAQRATAWAVVQVAEVCRPRWLAVENVPEFARWTLYRHWRAALSTLGYRITERVLDAAEHGVPQERRRLFVVGSLERLPSLSSAGLEPVPASTFVDFERGSWSPVAGHVPRTLERVAAAQREHGPRVLVPYYGSARGGRPLSRPVGTITTRDRYAVIDGDRMRMLDVSELRAAMGFPPSYPLTGTREEQVHQLGNAVVPAVAAHVVRQLLGANTNAQRGAA